MLDRMILQEEKNESSVSTQRDNDDIAWRWWNWQEAASKGMPDGKKEEVVIWNYAIVARAIYTRIYISIARSYWLSLIVPHSSVFFKFAYLFYFFIFYRMIFAR